MKKLVTIITIAILLITLSGCNSQKGVSYNGGSGFITPDSAIGYMHADFKNIEDKYIIHEFNLIEAENVRVDLKLKTTLNRDNNIQIVYILSDSTTEVLFDSNNDGKRYDNSILVSLPEGTGTLAIIGNCQKLDLKLDVKEA